MVIYITTNLINGKKYIGIDKNNNPDYIGSGKLLIKAIKKYGKENFKKKILESCNSIDELCEREKYWIKYFNATKNKNFYNIAEGGLYGGNLISGYNEIEFEKWRRKLSLAGKGRKKSEEHKRKLSENNFNKGRKITDKIRNKIIDTIKMNGGREGINNPRFGIIMDEELKKKISINKKKKYKKRIWINKDGKTKWIKAEDLNKYNSWKRGRVSKINK